MQSEHQFLLVCESSVAPLRSSGQWRFVAEYLDGRTYLEASDVEPGDRNRLGLLAVVRGLEALPGPAEVTLLASSRYVVRSMAERLPRWRESGFCWEHFGQQLPITDADLWKRVDAALRIHDVSACCISPAGRVSVASSPRGGHAPTRRSERTCAGVSDTLRHWLMAQCQGLNGDYEATGRAAMAVA
jgi:ribonuclease HI